jgi:hypothetical protein
MSLGGCMNLIVCDGRQDAYYFVPIELTYIKILYIDDVYSKYNMCNTNDDYLNNLFNNNTLKIYET